MRRKTVSLLLMFLLVMLNTLFMEGQVTIGSSEPPAKGALLQLKNENNVTNGGANANGALGMPRVKLNSLAIETGNDLKTTIKNATGSVWDKDAHAGLLVYNVFDNKKDICGGLYVWSGELWVRLGEPCSCSSPESLPTVTSTIPTTICSGSAATISATPSSGSIKWYDTASGGTAISLGISGNNLTTSALTVDKIYYAEAVTANGCVSTTRTAVKVTVTARPTITSTIPTTICSGNTATISATPSSGSIKWYDTASGGTAISLGISGNNLTTSALTVDKIYYAEAVTANGCVSTTRTAVKVTVTARPTITSTIPTTICSGYTATISATPSSGSIKWYDTASGGTAISLGISGNNLTTSALTVDKIYYAEAVTANGCVSTTRTAVKVTVTARPTITSTIPTTICSGNTATISATPSSGSIKWYDTASGGTAISLGISGNNLTTSALTVDKIYYAEAVTANGCVSTTRTAVKVTVLPKVEITSTTGSSVAKLNGVILSKGQVSAIATPANAKIEWYNNATGGTRVAEGATYAMTVTQNVTYYAEAVLTSGAVTCRSPRIPAVVTVVDQDDTGVYTMEGKTCFDVNMTSSASCGPTSSRTDDFMYTKTFTYEFKATNTYTELRFSIIDEGQTLVLPHSINGNKITIKFRDNIREYIKNNGTKYVTIVATFKDVGGRPKGASIELKIQDCSCCGAYISATQWKVFKCHNLGANENVNPFAPSKEINGDYYQWGKNVPSFFGSNHPTLPDQMSGPSWPISSYDNSWLDNVKTGNDPCPNGFRVPTKADWDNVLAQASRNPIRTVGTANDWAVTSASATNFRTGVFIGDGLFLPMAGFVNGDWNSSTATLGLRGMHGWYLSSTALGNNLDRYAINYNPIDKFNRMWSKGSNAYSVRCVAID